MLTIIIKSDSGPISEDQWEEITDELQYLSRHVEPPAEIDSDCQLFTMQWEYGDSHNAIFREDLGEEKEASITD